MPTPGQPRIQADPIVEAVGLHKRFGSTWRCAGSTWRSSQEPSTGCWDPTAPARPPRCGSWPPCCAPTAGAPRVGGFDVAREPEKVRPLIGLTGQYAAVDEELTGHGEPAADRPAAGAVAAGDARRRAGELLERFDLVEAGGRPLKTYSGGMRRRLDVAASLIGRPRGAVPGRADHRAGPARPRRGVAAWSAAWSPTARPCCSPPSTWRRPTSWPTELAVLDHGQVIEHGTPAELKARRGRADPRHPSGRARPARSGRRDPGRGDRRHPDPGRRRRHVSVPVDGRLAGTRTLAEVARRLDEAGIPVTEAGLRLTSLDEVFLALTGHPTKTTRGGAMNPTRAARHGLTLAWRSLLKLKHSPDQLLDVLLLPITFVLVFVFLFGKAVAGDWHTYLNYVLPGIAVQALMFASMGTALALNADLRTGIFDRFRSLPIARSAPLTGHLLGDLVKGRRLPGPGVRLRRHPRLPAPRRPAGPARRLRADRAVLLRGLLDRGPGGHAGQQPRQRPGLRLSVDLPAHLRQQRLRPHRGPAWLAAGLGEGQPGHPGLRRRPRAAAGPAAGRTRSPHPCCGRRASWWSSRPWRCTPTAARSNRRPDPRTA